MFNWLGVVRRLQLSFLSQSTRIRHRKVPRPASFCVAAAAAVLTFACGGGPEETTFTPFTVASGCSDEAKRLFVEQATREWYLYPDDLPSTTATAPVTDLQLLLDQLTATARAAGRDRFFSVATTKTLDSGFLARGEFLGLGFTLVRDSAGGRVWVAEVLEGSPAAQAGVSRGDEVLSIGTSESDQVAVGQILAADRGIEKALGANFPGVTRTIVFRNSAGQVVPRAIGKSSFPYVALPGTRVIDRSGLAPVGYLQLRAFVTSSAAEIREAFLQFRNRGVEDVVIDLRYNGGGALETAELLLNLLSGDRQPSDEMFRTQYHPRKGANSRVVRFSAESNSIRVRRIAFLTTRLSASASEVLINSLAPYVDVAIVGSRTLGKPVGNIAIDMPGCDVRVRLVAFDVLNSQGVGGFFAGLPDANFSDTYCETADDLGVPVGAPADPLLGAALHWVSNAVCPVAVPAGAAGAQAPKSLQWVDGASDRERVSSPFIPSL
jgi:C-terminal processing protease CtpA/Prc